MRPALQRSVVLLRGEDGMGKTRLVAEFVKGIGPKAAVVYASGRPRDIRAACPL